MTGGSKRPEAFRTISEAAEELGVAQHVLRFWESKFPEVSPMKRGGNRRYYRAEDMALLAAINKLLYTDGYTIKGVQKLLAEHGVRGLVEGTGAEAPASVPVTAPALPLSLDTLPAGDLSALSRVGQDPVRLKQLAAELRSIRDRLAAALDD